MSVFVIPVLLRLSPAETPDDKSFYCNMYVELEIEAETHEEAVAIAHVPVPASGGPKKFADLLNIIEVNKWEPDKLPKVDIVMD